MLAENEDGIERCAQFVRHVRKELRLVFRGQRKLGCLLFECTSSLLDLGIFTLDLGILFCKQFGLSAQFLIGLLELALTGLQCHRKLLRLGQQALGAHRCLNGIEDRTNALREEIEERKRASVEMLKRGQFNHGLCLTLEKHGQHNDAHLPSLAQTGGDRNEIWRHVGK